MQPAPPQAEPVQLRPPSLSLLASSFLLLLLFFPFLLPLSNHPSLLLFIFPTVLCSVLSFLFIQSFSSLRYSSLPFLPLFFPFHSLYSFLLPFFNSAVPPYYTSSINPFPPSFLFPLSPSFIHLSFLSIILQSLSLL